MKYVVNYCGKNEAQKFRAISVRKWYSENALVNIQRKMHSEESYNLIRENLCLAARKKEELATELDEYKMREKMAEPKGEWDVADQAGNVFSVEAHLWDGCTRFTNHDGSFVAEINNIASVIKLGEE